MGLEIWNWSFDDKSKSESDEMWKKVQNRDFYFTIFFEPGSAGFKKIKVSHLCPSVTIHRRLWKIASSTLDLAFKIARCRIDQEKV